MQKWVNISKHQRTAGVRLHIWPILSLHANPRPTLARQIHTSTGYTVSKANTRLRHISTAKESLACESSGAKWSGSTGPQLHTTSC